MNIENCISETHLDPEKNLKESWNGEGNQFIGDGHVINGISNGYTEKHVKKDRPPDYKEKHKEKHKDGHKEHREKDREKERDKHKDKDRHSSSSKDKDKHSSSSSKDKERRHKDEKRDKERHERKDGEKHERKEGDKHEKKEGEKHERKDGDRHDKRHSEKHERKEGDKHERKEDKHGHDKKDNEKYQKKDGEKHEKRDKDRDREKEKKDRDERKDKDREHKSSSSKDKEHKSSSSSKDKEKHSSSSNDKSSSSNKDRDKDRTSSSNKDKHSSSSSSRDKHSEKKHSDKDKEKHKSREKDSKEKSKHRESETVAAELKENNSEYNTKSVDKFDDIKIEPKEESSVNVGYESPQVKQEPGDTEESFYNYSAFSQPSMSASQIKAEEDSDDDIPLAARSVKRHMEESDEDDVPLLKRQKVKKEKSKKRKAESDEEEEFTPEKKSKSKSKNKNKIKPEKVKKEKVKTESQTEVGSPRKKKKEEEQQEVWKWWEEEKREDGVKWTFLEHKGPVFAPPYERLPPDVKFFYDGKEIRLSEEAEEVATFYARMLDHDYTTKEAFNKNFFKEWRKVMTNEEKELIKDLSKCNFKHMHAYFVQKSEERKAMSKEEKKKLKEQNEELIKEYGFCTIDGHKERIGNFKLEPPGLFRGRGEHPKMGMLKKRLMPEDIIINCSKNSNIPKPPPGHRWKEVRHDQTVTWLVSWTENVQGSVKYIMLNPSSKLKGEKDWQKYETARKLHKSIDKIRREYREDWKSKEMRIRQRSVALYFIDKLALRAGNEKDEDQADTVGCCSLRVEHISLHEEKDGKENVVVFDFLGKDSIRYYNEVSVERRVFKNLQLFMQNKSTGDDLFDRLNTTVLNKHLNELMEGLTAKVFRTYNASITLQQQLDGLTDPDYTVQEKILAYNRANRAVAILCNHQRAVPKTHAKSMENLKGKIEAKKELVKDAERQYKDAKREAKHSSSAKSQMELDKRKKALDRLREQLAKLELQATDKEENKEIALGTSKLNYLDPRISVAWCKKHGVPIEKIYNKTQREKFRWAIDMAGPDYVF